MWHPARKLQPGEWREVCCVSQLSTMSGRFQCQISDGRRRQSVVHLADRNLHSAGWSTSPGVLVPVTGIKVFLRYALQRLPGAMTHPYLAPAALQRLLAAQQLVKSAVDGYELLVWDAYRTRETQRALFESYRAELAPRHPELTPSKLFALTREFVSDPDGVFPHGTGGAVDVTLLSGHTTRSMGTDFDEFVPEAAPDWFRLHPPANPEEEEAHTNRELLRGAMEKAGFVGIATEWWHFEFGTKTWSERTCNQSF
jgi:D-alanyl-D-alanine dipeptidase